MNETPVAETPSETKETPKVAKTRKPKKERNKMQATARKTKRVKKSSNGSAPMAILTEARLGYKVDKDNRTASGHPTVSTGDALAKALTGLSVADLKKVAKENGLAERWVVWEKRLNPGQLRMTIGNVLRGALRNEVRVTVLGKVVGKVKK